MIADGDLFQLLLTNQYLEETALKKAQEEAEQKQTSLYEMILRQDLISDENLGNLIADHYKKPFIILLKTKIPPELVEIIPKAVAKKEEALIFGQSGQDFQLATANPENNDFITMLEQKTGLAMKVYFATPRDIEESLKVYRQDLKSVFDEFLKQQTEVLDQNNESDAPIGKMVDTLIEYGYEDRASDIHIEPEEELTLIRFRIDGVLHDMLRLPRHLHDQIVTRVKVLSKLRTDEHLSAQDGKLRVKLAEEELDVRVSVVPIVGGEKIVLRLLTSRYRQFGLTDLGMSQKDLEKVKTAFEKPFGMILSTGPTGSGKTTTIYAILKILNSREKNIATIEDPVEYEIEGINQINVNPKTNLTFAEGLRSILRQDPDIVYVGEIRDEETAGIAINAAMTGHLVLSTLHTNDAATSLPRLIDMKIEPFLVSSTVNVIIGQRLVRRICERCKVSYTEKADDLSPHLPKEMLTKYFGKNKSIRLYKGKGCDVCHHSGYLGRIGIFEVLESTPQIQKLINQKADSNLIIKTAISLGMTTMLEDGLSKAQLGLTTIDEVLRAATSQ